MLVVHHLEKSRSQRIIWLLEELGVEYQITHYKRDPVTVAAPESLTNIHPLGKSPVITDGDLTIAESGAIIEYLIDTYDTQGRLKPTEGQALLDYRYWLHFAEGSFMPLLVMKLVFNKIESSPMPFFAKPIAKGICKKVQSSFLLPRVLPQLAFIEETLGKQAWFAGEQLSGADIQMSFPILASAARLDLSKYPNIAGFVKRIESLPNYQKAIESAGGFSLL